MTHTQADVLREYNYEPATGMLRAFSPSRKAYPWRPTGKNKRYLSGYVAGKTIYLHQAVFLYHHGYLPEQVDHLDRDTANNRIENLRPATNAENQYNGKRKANNRSGFKGVAYCKGYVHPWRARIVVDKRVVELGRYPTPEQASAAYLDGAKRFAKAFAFVGQ